MMFQLTKVEYSEIQSDTVEDVLSEPSILIPPRIRVVCELVLALLRFMKERCCTLIL